MDKVDDDVSMSRIVINKIPNQMWHQKTDKQKGRSTSTASYLVMSCHKHIKEYEWKIIEPFLFLFFVLFFLALGTVLFMFFTMLVSCNIKVATLPCMLLSSVIVVVPSDVCGHCEYICSVSLCFKTLCDFDEYISYSIFHFSIKPLN